MNKTLSRLVHDKNGKVAVWQTPNIPLIGWFVFLIAGHLASSGNWKSGFEFLSTAFLFTWAYLEVISGVSYFRRGLGLIVMLYIIISYLS